jgi:hypothetical protein
MSVKPTTAGSGYALVEVLAASLLASIAIAGSFSLISGVSRQQSLIRLDKRLCQDYSCASVRDGSAVCSCRQHPQGAKVYVTR